ncbi:MAG: hypothetical protein HQ543_02335 [Bacteroidetes bacterium]|nr:hypothetical protein [Bacteroidota bacterium]
MKTITILISMLTLLAFNGYSQKTDVKGLLDNQETRTAIFNAIAGDHELMMDFMKATKDNEHAMMMMQNENRKMKEMEGNKAMVTMKDDQKMMNGGNMMGMMKDNPEMMQKMKGNMMDMCERDSTMRMNMADMMIEHPKMMQMCMQKMKEKGMMGTDDKMKMMDMEGKSKVNNHTH